MTTLAVVGASGFAGSELLRLAASHPELELVTAIGDSQAGQRLGALYPGLAAAYPDLEITAYDPAAVAGVDVLALGLPHGLSAGLVPELLGTVGTIIDLASDFRLGDARLYPDWYGVEHPCPELLDSFVYGLPELNREQLVGAERIAVPGCYPTTAALALLPMLEAGLASPDRVIVDAASGVSGAGRPPKPGTTFCAVDENFTAYGLLTHRHTPEIEQATGARVLFTPHLAPMNRGILATCYLDPTGPTSTAELIECLTERYREHPFVLVTDEPPSTKSTMGSNMCHVSARYDERTGTIVVMSALDNLVKGTSGQAIQCLNLARGWPETLGLPRVGLTP